MITTSCLPRHASGGAFLQGYTAQAVADLNFGKFAAKTQILAVNGNVYILRKTLYQIPAFA
jgi:hypothetical protein